MIVYKEVKDGKQTGQGYEKIVNGKDNIWYRLNGQPHCADAPAVSLISGYEAWYINGKLHREDGPAIIWPDGRRECWLDGIDVTPENYHQYSPLQLAKLGLI